VGLRAGELVNPLLDGRSVLVQPDIAARQLEAERRPSPYPTPEPSPTVKNGEDGSAVAEPLKVLHRRFHGSVELDPIRVSRDAGQAAGEVIQHLTTQPGAKVQVTLEVSADLPEGAPETLVWIVTENCKTLRFRSSAFEEE
jgi:hypothetical protein